MISLEPLEVSDDEVTILVDRLQETQRRLQELAGGQLDAVLLPDGQSFLLQQAQEKLRQSAADLKVATDALRVSLDGTERQVAARTAELAAANVSLTDAVAHADAANLAKSQFLSRMSHELRTPMNAVLGYAQLLHTRYEEPEIKEFSGAILHGGRHLLNLIDEILDIGRVESGELSVSLERVAFDDVLSQALTLVQPIANAAGIHLTIHFEACRGLQVEADRRRLVQVLINLLSNAVKYNRKEGRVAAACVSGVDGMSRIEISDTGSGIASSDQAHLFEPFQRFGDPGIQGTGLGLALSHGFMKLMGGRLGLAESSERGSTFFVEMKPAEPAPSASVRAPEGAHAGLIGGLKGEVLCIEDNPANMRLMEMVIASWKGVSLIPASNGTIGLALALTHLPHLVLLDLNLPDIGGESILRQLKRDPRTSGIPVVVVSADATEKQIQALLAEGAAAYLTKPFDLTRLAEVFEQFLAKG